MAALLGEVPANERVVVVEDATELRPAHPHVVSLEARCNGVRKSFPDTENIQVNGADLAAVTSTLQAKLAQDKAISYT